MRKGEFLAKGHVDGWRIPWVLVKGGGVESTKVGGVNS